MLLGELSAKDFGTQGTTYVIEEENPIALIQQKLKIMADSGELEKRNQEIASITKASITRPKPVSGITKTTTPRVFYYDPTYRVERDLKDHKGQVFAVKDDLINTLDKVKFSQTLIFFDGDDEEQCAWAQTKIKDSSVKLVLIKGAPLELSQKWETHIYFDQNGYLTKKLGIRHVPAIVKEENKRIQIEEISLKEKK
jgi:conjugal transfer pilus assembly protein TraW